MTEPRPDSLEHFSDDDARAILKRAAEIEKRGLVSETDLREIAGQASISQAAINRALAEAQEEKRLAFQMPRDPAVDLPFYRQRIPLRTLGWGIAAAWLVAGLLNLIFGG